MRQLVLLFLMLHSVANGFSFRSSPPYLVVDLLRRRQQQPNPLFAIAAASSEVANEGDDYSHDPIRLNKVFKATHSRRQADDLIASGRVTINGNSTTDRGRRVVPYHDVIRLDGQIIKGWEALNACASKNIKHRSRRRSNNDGGGSTSSSQLDSSWKTTSTFEYIKYWKPKGVVCTTDKSIRSNILHRLEKYDGYRPNHRVYPVGRLDKDTSGLILLTSDGRLPNSALRGRYKQPKKYHVVVNEPLTSQQVQELRDGIVITTQAQRDSGRKPPLTAKTMPCQVEVSKRDRRKLQITLVEGRNRQIRKMIAALGLHVISLHRCEFMNIRLQPLQRPGDWIPLSSDEMTLVSRVISSAAAAQESDRRTVEESC